MTFIGSESGSKIITLPPHQPGDLLIAWAYRDGSVLQPTVPTGWTSIIGGGANTNSGVVAYQIATSNNHTPDSWTGATALVFLVYRPNPGATVEIGAASTTGGLSNTVIYNRPGVGSGEATLQRTDGTSWVLAFAGHRSNNTALETPPPGMVYRNGVQDLLNEAHAFDTDGGVATWPLDGSDSVSVAVGGSSSGFRTATVEVIVSEGGEEPEPTDGRSPRSWVMFID